MKFAISDWALKRRILFVVLLIIIVIAGTSSFLNIQKEWFPDVQIPLLIVSTPYPGASPNESEHLVTNKLEVQLKNIKNLKKISSVSAEGVSLITLRFYVGTEISEAKTIVRDAIDRVRSELPSETKESTITEINLSEQPIMNIIMSGSIGMAEMTKLAEDIRDDLDGIQGVLENKIIGGVVRQVQVEADPLKLFNYGITLDQIIQTIASDNLMIAAGQVEISNQKYSTRIAGEITDPSELNKFIIRSNNGQTLYLNDVADIKFGYADRTSLSRSQGKDSITITVAKRSGENLQLIADKAKKIIAKYEKELNGAVNFSYVSDQSNKVNDNINGLLNSIILGFLTVWLVLFLFMGFNNALQTGLVIPVAMLLSMIILNVMGVTLNVVVLFGLILSTGILVDDSIVVVENIYRHMQQGKSKREACQIGTAEIAWPVITTSLTTIAAFFPLLFMPGTIGDFMKYLPIVLIITVSA